MWTSKSLQPIIYKTLPEISGNRLSPPGFYFVMGKMNLRISFSISVKMSSVIFWKENVNKSPSENPVFTCSAYPRTTCLCFKLLSPSRPEVSMWQIPSGSVENSKTMSAGITSLQERRIKSPTATSFQHWLTYFFSFLILGRGGRFKENIKT